MRYTQAMHKSWPTLRSSDILEETLAIATVWASHTWTAAQRL
jgi:hypothetical protein